MRCVAFHAKYYHFSLCMHHLMYAVTQSSMVSFCISTTLTEIIVIVVLEDSLFLNTLGALVNSVLET